MISFEKEIGRKKRNIMFSLCVNTSGFDDHLFLDPWFLWHFLGSSGSRFAEGNPSWGAGSLLFLSPGLLPICPRPQHPSPRAPLGRPGVLWGQPGAPQTPPLGTLSDVLSSVTEVCAGHQMDRRGPHSDGLMPRAEKLQPCRPHLPRIRNTMMKSLSNSNL